MRAQSGQMRKHYRTFILRLLGICFIVIFLTRSGWLSRIFLSYPQAGVKDNQHPGLAKDVFKEEVSRPKSILRQIIENKAAEQTCDIPHLKAVTKSDLGSSKPDCSREKPKKSSCKLAQQLFGDPSSLDITGACRTENTVEYCHLQGQPDGWKVVCEPHLCASTMFLGIMDTVTGAWRWSHHRTVQEFQEQIAALLETPNMGYCLLHCGKLADIDNLYDESFLIEIQPQLLNLPPVKTDTKQGRKSGYININFIFIDSVSRHHFFRSLPRSVSTLNTLSKSDNGDLLLLDFELFQAVRSRTFETIQGLFSGHIDPFEIPFGTQEMPREKLNVRKLLQNLKIMGFINLWIEDLCPYWEWGLAKDLLVYNSSLEVEDLHRSFLEAVKKGYLDSIGNTFSSCDILHANRVPDPFHRPSKICYNGRHQHEYLLEYLSVFQRTMLQRSQPFFSFFETNVGHEGSGKRIQYIDHALADYLNFTANLQNTLTIVFSDHGNAYGDFVQKAPEGRIEMYQPFMFMIIPKSVQDFFTDKELLSIQTNQHRLITILDLHYTFAYIIEKIDNRISDFGESRNDITSEAESRIELQSKVSEFNKQFNVTKFGLFANISTQRTCSHTPRIMPNLCICTGYDVKSNDHFYHFILAMYFVGVINNEVQRQHKEKGLTQRGGFGRCKRLKVEKIKNIHMSSQNLHTKMAKMDLYVQSPGQTAADIYFIGIKIDHDSNMSLGNFERITPYSKYMVCKDTEVDVKLCICDVHDDATEEKHDSQTSQSAAVREETEAQAYVRSSLVSEMTSNVTLYNVNGKLCLYLISQSNSVGVVYELYNNCNRALNLHITLTTKNLLLSGPGTQHVTSLPDDFTFIAAGVHKTKQEWSSAIFIEV